MNPVKPYLRILAATVVVLTPLVVLFDNVLDLGQVGQWLAIGITMFLVSLTDRDRFYGADILREQR